MKKSTQILQKISIAKDEMKNFLDSGKIQDAHNMISIVANLEKELDKAIAEEQEEDFEGFSNSNKQNQNTKNSGYESIYQNEREGDNMKDFIKAKSVKNSADFKAQFVGESANSDISFSNFIKGVLFNDNEHAKFKNKVDGTVVIPQEVVADIIYSATPRSVLLGNCPILPMEAETVKIGRVKTDVTTKFKLPYVAGEESNFELEGVELKAKTLFSWIEVSEEDLQDIQNIEQILKNTFGNAAAKALDKAFLYNEFTPEMTDLEKSKFPKGIMDDATILSVEGLKPFDYLSIAKAKKEISKNDGFANVLALTPDDNFLLESATDLNGQFITEPKFMEQLNKIESNNIKVDGALVFDSESILIGIRKEMNFKVMDSLKNGTVLIRLQMRCDVATTRPNNVCKIEMVDVLSA